MRVPTYPRLLVAALVIVAATAVALLTSRGGVTPPAPARVTILQDDAIFLHGTPAAVDAAMAQLQSLGVDWVRLTAQWSVLAPQPAAAARPSFDARDPNAYPPHVWDFLDRAVVLAQRHGMRADIDIAFWAPRWATSRAVLPPARQRWGIDPRAYADFATAVARRYSGHFHGLPAAAAFTIWNEPNLGVFFLPQWRRAGDGWEVASADSYREMLYAAVPAIAQEAPDAVVLIGATAAGGTIAGRRPAAEVAPLRFLRELACVDDRLSPLRTGACAHFRPLPGDGWAHHPYSNERPPTQGDPRPDTVALSDLGRLTGLLARLHALGRTERALGTWITEFGYETNPPDPTRHVTPAQQAAWLPEARSLAYGNPAVRSFAQFQLRDLPARPGATAAQRWGDYQTGLLYSDGAPKPAFDAFRRALSGG